MRWTISFFNSFLSLDGIQLVKCGNDSAIEKMIRGCSFKSFFLSPLRKGRGSDYYKALHELRMLFYISQLFKLISHCSRLF